MSPTLYVTWKVWLVFVHKHPLYLYLYLHLPLCSTNKLLKSNYKKRHPMMLISQSLGLASSNPLRHEGCWAHGLGFLGLGLKHLLYLVFIGNLAWPLRENKTSTEKRTNSRYIPYVARKDEPKMRVREESTAWPKFRVSIWSS